MEEGTEEGNEGRLHPFLLEKDEVLKRKRLPASSSRTVEESTDVEETEAAASKKSRSSSVGDSRPMLLAFLKKVFAHQSAKAFMGADRSSEASLVLLEPALGLHLIKKRVEERAITSPAEVRRIR